MKVLIMAIFFVAFIVLLWKDILLLIFIGVLTCLVLGLFYIVNLFG